MDNKNRIRIFCGFTGSYKKRKEPLDEPQDTNCWKNYLINTMLNLKTKFVWEKKKNAIISEMTWCNVLQRTDSDFCATNNFQGTSHFRFVISTQEKINTYVDPSNLQLQGVFQMPLSLHLIIVEKELWR